MNHNPCFSKPLLPHLTMWQPNWDLYAQHSFEYLSSNVENQSSNIKTLRTVTNLAPTEPDT